MSLDHLKSVVRAALSPRYFFVAPGGRLRVEFVAAERLPWELHQGQLLPPTVARHEKEFAAWNIWHEREAKAGGPVISVLHDSVANCLHVVRGFAQRSHVAVETEENVFDTREVDVWARELVSTIELKRLAQLPAGLWPADVQAENLSEHNRSRGVTAWLKHGLFLAGVGTSPLAITSLESPLAEYAFGQFAYLPDDGDAADGAVLETSSELIRRAFELNSETEAGAKALEAGLRTIPAADVESFSREVWDRCRALGGSSKTLTSAIRRLFNDVVLTPYAAFGDRFLAWIGSLHELPDFAEQADVDLIADILSQLVRHLTAYDLVTFHNAGANYPDAIVLDGLLKLYLRRIEQSPGLFAADAPGARRRRRGLRQGWLLRRRYEQHPVPDAPTSPGEQLRTAVAADTATLAQQLSDPSTRRRRLFDEDPLEIDDNSAWGRALRESVDDLRHGRELFELGAATYLDRPLGHFKTAGETDRTILLSYVAFSRSIAKHRLRWLASDGGLLNREMLGRLKEQIDALPVAGRRVTQFMTEPRPGVVCLEDAARAASDFIFVRTTRHSRHRIISDYDFSALAKAAPQVFRWLCEDPDVLLIRELSPDGPMLVALDGQAKQRLTIHPANVLDDSSHYMEIGGREWIAGGLKLRFASETERSGAGQLEAEIALPPTWDGTFT